MFLFPETCPFYLPQSNPTIGTVILCSEIDDEGRQPLLPVKGSAGSWQQVRKLEPGRLHANELTCRIPM